MAPNHARPRGRGSRPGPRTVALFSLLVAFGCSGDSGAPTGIAGSLTLSLALESILIAPGSVGEVPLTAGRSPGFTAPVTITVEGNLEGMAVAPLLLPAGAGPASGALSLGVTAGATPGPRALVVRASAPGAADRTAALLLTVGTTPNPGFTLALSPTNLSVEAGGSAQVSVELVRLGGFTGPVTLAADGLPAGLTATFTPPAPSLAQAVLSVSATPQAAPTGPVPVVVRGTSDGVAPASVDLLVTVLPAPAGPEVTFDFCERSGLPIWVAYQDGSGPWTRVTGPGPSWTLPIAEDTGGLAWVVEAAPGAYETVILQATRPELQTLGSERCHGTPGAGSPVTGTVAGLPAVDPGPIHLSLGRARPDPTPPTGLPAITFPGVPAGPVDLVGGVATHDPINALTTPSRILLRRGLLPASGTLPAPVDFEGPDGFAPATRALIVQGVGGGESVDQRTTLRTAHGEGTVAVVALQQNSWFGVPADRLAPADLQLLTVTVTGVAGPFAPRRAVTRVLREPQAVTLLPPPHLLAPATTALPDAGHARARTVYDVQPEYDRFWSVAYRQTEPGAIRTVRVERTAAHRGAAAGPVTLEIPHLAGAAGWEADWGLRPGIPVTWEFQARGWTDPGGIVEPILAEGVTFEWGIRTGQFTP